MFSLSAFQPISKQRYGRTAGAGREMAGPPTSPFGRAPPHPHSSPACISRFLYPSIAQLVALSHCYFFLVFDSMTSIMAPAHPYLTGLAMYPAFFQCSSAQTPISREV